MIVETQLATTADKVDDGERRWLFLDLEDTVITPNFQGWHLVELINVEKIKAFIAEFKPHSLNLFSFAIHGQRDRSLFEKHVQPMLQDALGMELGMVPDTNQIAYACCNVMGLAPSTVDFQEMSNFWGKHEAFRLFVRHAFRGQRNWPLNRVEVVLVDDAVLNERFEWPGLGIAGRIINVDTL